MRIHVEGASTVAHGVASQLARAGVLVTAERPDLTITVEDSEDSPLLVVDGIDCDLERHIVTSICELTSEDVALRRKGGEVHSESALRILVPAGDQRAAEAVEKGVMRGVVTHMQNQTAAIAQPPPQVAIKEPVYEELPFGLSAGPARENPQPPAPTLPPPFKDIATIVLLVLILLTMLVGKAHGQAGTNVNVRSVGGVAVTANGSGAIKVTCPDGTCSGGGGGGGGTISVIDAGGSPQTVGYDGASTNAPVALMTAIPVGANVIGKITISQGGNDATVSAGGALKVDGSASTQPISAASLPLPSGAATAAKQPALGTAGTASADVITIQGIASMTAVKTDGSGVTQPVSGTVTATQSTASSLKAQVQVIDGAGDSAMDNTNDALRVNVVAGGAGDGAILDGVSSSIKGTVLDYTNSNPLAVRLTDTNGDYVGAGAGTQYSNGSAQATPTGTVSLGWDTANVRALRTDSNGRLSVDVNSAPTTTVTGTVTANIGTSGSLALDASVTGLQVTQGSTTSGQKGELAMGAVTTGAPSYTTAQTSPLSLTTAGALRVDNSANTQPISASSLPLPSGAATAAKQPALGTAGSASADVITVQGIASMTALKVDGSDVTQPVSGTVTANVGTTNGLALDATIGRSQGSTTSGQTGPLVQGAVTTSAPSYTTAQTSPLSLTTAGALRTDSSATTQPVSGTVTANAGTGNFGANITQVGGNTVNAGTGNSGTGTLRVVLATDQPQLTNKLLVTPDANSAVNLAQLGGNSVSSGNGTSGTGTIRAAVVSDNTAVANWGHAAIGAAPPTGSTMASGIASGATGGLLSGITICDSFANVSQTANTQIITGVSGRRIRICAINLVTATAQNVAVVAGTGTTCGTSTVAVPGTSGGTTAATGWNFAANAGIAHGSGLGEIARTTVNADNLCILQSGSGQLSGGISYAIY